MNAMHSLMAIIFRFLSIKICKKLINIWKSSYVVRSVVISVIICSIFSSVGFVYYHKFLMKEFRTYVSSKKHYTFNQRNRCFVSSMPTNLVDILRNNENGLFINDKTQEQLESYNFARYSEELFVNLCKSVCNSGNSSTLHYKVISIITNEYPSTNWTTNGTIGEIYNKINNNKSLTNINLKNNLAAAMYGRYKAIQNQKITKSMCNGVEYIRIIDYQKPLKDAKQHEIFTAHTKNIDNDLLTLQHINKSHLPIEYGLYYIVWFEDSELYFVLYSYGDHQSDKDASRIALAPMPRGYAIHTKEEFQLTDVYRYLRHNEKTDNILRRINL